MAGHLRVNSNENLKLVEEIYEFLNNHSNDINKMQPYLRYDKNLNLADNRIFDPKNKHYQKLIDRFEIDDNLVISISPYDMWFKGELTENAIAEIHISKLSHRISINKIYMVY